MGFRTGAYAKVWSVESKSDKVTKIRISISRKNKEGGYDQEFSGFVSVLGSAAAKNALSLKDGDRIKLGDVDVSNEYNKDTRSERVSYKMFSFETVDDMNSSKQQSKPAPKQVDDGEPDPDLPF